MSRCFLARIGSARQGRVARALALTALVAGLTGCSLFGGGPGVVYHGGMRYGPWWLAEAPVEGVAIGRPLGGATSLKPASTGTKAARQPGPSDAASAPSP